MEVEIPYHEKCNVECMYLLGQFGVEVVGKQVKTIEQVTELAFADITTQGLPFYGGNIKYKIEVDIPEGELNIQVSKFRSPVIKVNVDGNENGYIEFSPYQIKTEKLAAGRHIVEFIAYGNRINTFGTLHNADEKMEWYGANAWRAQEESWAYEYQLTRTGILKSPCIYVTKNK